MARPPSAPHSDRVSQRLSEGLDGVAERIDSGFASVRSAIDDLAEHVRKVEARTNARLESQDATLAREFGHMEIGIGELRDRVNQLETTTLPAAAAKAAAGMAEGAARGAGEAAGAVATLAAAAVASNTSKPFLKTWVGRVVVACSAFTALITALGVVPNVLKGVELFWKFITGLAK